MRRIAIYRALARGVVLESLRRKDVWVVAILGFLVIAAAGALGFFGFRGLEVFAKDLALTTLGLFSTIVAILVSARQLPEEIRNRTLYPLLARPISRFDLLVGKWLGSVAVSWAGFTILGGLVAVALLMFGVRLEPILLQYALCKAMGLAVVCAVSLALSAYWTPAAAATLAFLAVFGSSLLGRALVMAGAASPEMRPVFAAIHAILPQVHLFDLSSRAVNDGWPAAPLWVVGALAAYMAVYCAGMLGMSWIRFRRQAI